MIEKINPATTIEKHFGSLSDPRIERTKHHKMLDILVITICAVICGADDYVAIHEFGEAKEEWLKEYLELPNGIPSHDTFWRFFRALDPEGFQNCFLKWMRSISKVTAGEVIAIDGKRLRRSHDKEGGKAAIHMVSAWATRNRLVLGQEKVDEKSNEITAIPELLRCLEIMGCLVTIDAMGCQTNIASLIRERGADYLLALKGNQSNLHDDVILLFDDLAESNFTAYAYDYHKTVDKGHGRIEVRHCWTISDPVLISCLRGAGLWKDLLTLVKVKSERYIGDKYESDVRYFISSAATLAADALYATRTHWCIENSLHWVLDIAFREDESRLRKGFGAQNFAVLRHIALNALNQESSAKIGVKNKRLRAGWDNSYLFDVLLALFG